MLILGERSWDLVGFGLNHCVRSSVAVFLRPIPLPTLLQSGARKPTNRSHRIALLKSCWPTTPATTPSSGVATPSPAPTALLLLLLLWAAATAYTTRAPSCASHHPTPSAARHWRVCCWLLLTLCRCTTSACCWCCDTSA